MVLPLPKSSPPDIFNAPEVTLTPVARTTLASVPVLALSTDPLPLPIVPPLSASVALPPIVTAPPVAVNTTLSLPPPTALSPALMLMLLCATKVNVTSVALLVLMAPAIVMSPTPVPALVVMVTLVPASSAVLMVEAKTSALSAVVTMDDVPLNPASVPLAATVMLWGSSNQTPAAPWVAEASAAWPTLSNRLPDVSIAPPSPPWMPPRADSFPSTVDVSSDQATTVPPLPRCPALAVSVAVAAI